jgi:hypothetical protein
LSLFNNKNIKLKQKYMGKTAIKKNKKDEKKNKKDKRFINIKQ